MNKFKGLGLLVIVPLLTGCSVFNNLVNGIGLDYLLGTNVIITKVDISETGTTNSFEEMPTTEATRATLVYGQTALVIPTHVETIMYNVEIKLDFTFSFDGIEADHFAVFEQSVDEVPDMDMSMTAKILYPTGTAENPADVDAVEDWLTLEVILELEAQQEVDFTLKLTGTGGNKTKNKIFYFKLVAPEIGVLE